MKKIAICGNIASGKSTVQEYIQNQGFKVLDTDDVSHDLLTINNKKLYEAFKNYDVFENGEFSRYKMGQLIFFDSDKKLKLESVLHPQIEERIKDFFEKNKNDKLLFVAIPLLFEAKMEKLFDKIIFIYADDSIRLKRLIERNNYTEEYAQSRINCQMPQVEKINLSDYVIRNNGSIDKLKQNIKKTLKEIELS